MHHNLATLATWLPIIRFQPIHFWKIQRQRTRSGNIDSGVTCALLCVPLVIISFDRYFIVLFVFLTIRFGSSNSICTRDFLKMYSWFSIHSFAKLNNYLLFSRVTHVSYEEKLKELNLFIPLKRRMPEWFNRSMWNIPRI